jgi:hypothetical protein
MSMAAAFEPIAAVISVAKGVFDRSERDSRIRISILTLCDELESIRAELPSDATVLLQGDWFKRTVRTMMEEAARSTNDERARKLAIAAAHGCFPRGDNAHRREDLATYIHDLARLGLDDVQMLKLLRDAYREPIRTTPNMHDPNYFTEHFAEFKEMATDLKIHPDDCVALGARLSGFGLAYEVMWNSSRQSTGEHCFRPTRRGVYLLSLLEAAETPPQQRN